MNKMESIQKLNLHFYRKKKMLEQKFQRKDSNCREQFERNTELFYC